MKLTNKAKSELRRILERLESGESWILSDSVVIARRSSGTTTTEYQNRDGEHIAPLFKEAGSPFNTMQTAIDGLRRFIDSH